MRPPAASTPFPRSYIGLQPGSPWRSIPGRSARQTAFGAAEPRARFGAGRRTTEETPMFDATLRHPILIRALTAALFATALPLAWPGAAHASSHREAPCVAQ